MIRQHGAVVRGVGSIAPCDAADFAEGLCTPPPDFTVTGTGVMPVDPATDGILLNATSPFWFLSGAGVSPQAQAIAAAAAAANAAKVPVPMIGAGVIPKCGFDNLNACGAQASGWISQHSTAFAAGLLLLVVLAAAKGGRK